MSDEPTTQTIETTEMSTTTTTTTASTTAVTDTTKPETTVNTDTTTTVKPDTETTTILTTIITGNDTTTTSGNDSTTAESIITTTMVSNYTIPPGNGTTDPGHNSGITNSTTRVINHADPILNLSILGIFFIVLVILSYGLCFNTKKTPKVIVRSDKSRKDKSNKSQKISGAVKRPETDDIECGARKNPEKSIRTQPAPDMNNDNNNNKKQHCNEKTPDFETCKDKSLKTQSNKILLKKTEPEKMIEKSEKVEKTLEQPVEKTAEKSLDNRPEPKSGVEASLRTDRVPAEQAAAVPPVAPLPAAELPHHQES